MTVAQWGGGERGRRGVTMLAHVLMRPSPSPPPLPWQLADGPDEVHLAALGKSEIRRQTK